MDSSEVERSYPDETIGKIQDILQHHAKFERVAGSFKITRHMIKKATDASKTSGAREVYNAAVVAQRLDITIDDQEDPDIPAILKLAHRKLSSYANELIEHRSHLEKEANNILENAGRSYTLEQHGSMRNALEKTLASIKQMNCSGGFVWLLDPGIQNIVRDLHYKSESVDSFEV